MPKQPGIRFPRGEALSVARYLLIRLNPNCDRIAISGSLRRETTDCGDVDVLVVPTVRLPRPVYVQAVLRAILDRVSVMGDDVVIGDVLSGEGHLVPINVFMTAPENWGAALHYTTGCREYNIAVRGRAKRRGLRADQYGVWIRPERGRGPGTFIVGSGETEESYCRTIGIPWIPPALRTSGSLVARYR